MRLDLRRDGRLTVEQSKYITSIEESVRLEYNNYISTLASSNRISGLGWLSRVLSRNPHITFLLHDFCRIQLLKNILTLGDRIEIIEVDSSAMQVVCMRILKDKNYSARVVLSNSHVFNFPLLKNFAKSFYFITNFFLWPKLAKRKNRPTGSIIYLDTFLFTDSFDKSNCYHDRYYPGLLDNFDDKSKVWHVPTLIGFLFPQDFWRIFHSVRQSDKQFLMKEDWLTLKDYLMAIIYSYQIPNKITKIPKWKGIDIKELVWDEIHSNKFSMDLINPLLIYLFIGRLKKENISLEIALDWNENQVIDRALVLGIKKFYPGVKINGYQGYAVPDFYTCKDPTELEYRSGILPDEIYVIGEKFVKSKKKYCSDLTVSVAPAFRFSNMHKINLRNRKPLNRILIVLPISLSESDRIISICLDLVKQIGSQYQFYIKHHPSYTQERIIKLLPNIDNPSLNFIKHGLYQQLLNASMLISSSSSVCIEAALMGVSVAIIGSNSGPAMNPLKSLPELTNWRVCYSSLDIENFLLVGDNFKQQSLVSHYFSPVSRIGVSSLLSVS